MHKLEILNPLARKMAAELLGAFPQFKRHLEVLEKGNFRTRIRALKGSKVYGLRVCTVNGEDTWVQFGVPNAFYDADTERQLLQIIRGLMTDRLKFGIRERKGKWTCTTLVRKPGDLVLTQGETGAIHSWTGTKDDVVWSNTVRRHLTRASRSAHIEIRPSVAAGSRR